jgi:NADH-quinone oxidoreductase subunit N
VLGCVLGFALLCLAGLPPGVMGLVAKVVALAPVVAAHAWLLTAVAVLNVVLGVAVYLRWGVRLVAAARPVPAPASTPDGGADVRRRLGVPHAAALLIGAASCFALSILPALVANPLS